MTYTTLSLETTRMMRINRGMWGRDGLMMNALPPRTILYSWSYSMSLPLLSTGHSWPEHLELLLPRQP